MRKLPRHKHKNAFFITMNRQKTNSSSNWGGNYSWQGMRIVEGIMHKALVFLPPFSVRTLWLWALHIWEVFTSATIIKWLQRPVRGGLFALATHISFQFYGISRRQVLFRFFSRFYLKIIVMCFTIVSSLITKVQILRIKIYICIMIYL